MNYKRIRFYLWFKISTHYEQPATYNNKKYILYLFQVENHMTLSQYGCMQRLLDFIRMNKDDELLEIIGKFIIGIYSMDKKF